MNTQIIQTPLHKWLKAVNLITSKIKFEEFLRDQNKYVIN